MADSDFHVHCQKGNLAKVKQIVQSISKQKLDDILISKRGVFGYTPLHDAAVNGNTDILDYLLEKTKNAHVNVKANGGYTALHVAISSGKKESVLMLLSHHAELEVTDEFDKTPRQVAELNNQVAIAQILIQEKLYREVERDGSNVVALVQQHEEKIDKECLNRCLKAATLNDSATCISLLVARGANGLESCLHLAQREKKHHSCAMLLLVMAAYSGNTGIIRKLFDHSTDSEESRTIDHVAELLPDVQQTLRNGTVLTAVPIDIALKQGNHQVRDLLLLNTNVNERERNVNWSNLYLQQLQLRWIQEISWVKSLLLGGNSLDSLPSNICDHLLQVVVLDLKHNKISAIPQSLLSLPALEELYLTHNSLKKLPHVPKWPENLLILDLSFNKLSTLSPDHIEATNLKQLDISNNSLSKVPTCICSFLNLTDLNLSNNPSILDLPLQMGRLFKLQRLELGNLELREPPREIRKNTRECIDYLYARLRNAKSFYHMKVLVVGAKKTGKTTLVQNLIPRGKEKNKLTESGIEISQWSYKSSLMKQTFSFEIWDFNGPNATAVQYLFYCHEALYLLVFDLTNKTSTIKGLRGTLDTITQRASFSMVILVGTYQQTLGAEEEAITRSLLGQVQLLIKSYKDQLQVVEEIVTISLKNGSSNISQLKNLIYSSAAKYKTCLGRDVMGLKIPATYHDLDKQIRSQQQVIHRGIPVPIMHLDDLKTTIKQMKIISIMEDDPKLTSLTEFLMNRGSLIFHNTRLCYADELIFTDPQWLYQTVMTIMSAETLPNRGLLLLKDLLYLLKDMNQFKYIDQLLVMLDDFELGLLMDNQCLLIASALQDQPDNLIQPLNNRDNYCYRYIVYNARKFASISWIRLLSMIIFMIPCLKSAFTKIVTSSTPKSQTGTSVPQPRHSIGNQTGSFQSSDRSYYGSIDMVRSYSARRTQKNPNGSERAQSWSETSSLPLASPRVAIELEVECVQRLLAESKFMPPLSNTPHVESSSVSSVNADNSDLTYWKSGLHFRSSSVTLQMESLAECPDIVRKERDGILITVSCNAAGRQLTGQVVEVIHACINQWCDRARGGHNSAIHLGQIAPCPKCIKAGKVPYEFKFDECLSLVAQNELCVTCGYDGDKNHSILIADVFPDLLLKDIQPDILLNSNELCWKEMNSSITSGTPYALGFYHNKNILLKSFSQTSKEAFRQLRQEATILQDMRHPCIAQLIGATLYPTMTLVMEAPPLGFLDKTLLNREIPIHRLTIFRIAAEVAAALSFIHSKGFVYNNLCAANVFLWSLDPKSMCHCKLGNFDAVVRKSFIGVCGSRGIVRFNAPEILQGVQSKQRKVYCHKADMFSFGMFLYQLVARKDPFANTPKTRIDAWVKAGRRPNLSEVNITYHYLCKLMRSCWSQYPLKRPQTSSLIKALCSASKQSVMSVSPVESRIPVSSAVAVTSGDMNKIGAPSVSHSEMWVCCNGPELAEVSVYNTHTMTLLHKVELPEKEVEHMVLCGMYMWLVVRLHDRRILQVYTVACCELLTTIDSLGGISCMTAGKDEIFVGTFKGYCYCISNSHVSKVLKNTKFPHIKISENKISGIVWTNDFLWLSHRHKITIINPRTLEPIASVRHLEDNWNVGSLIVSPAGDLVWSAHFKESSHLSAWNAFIHKHVLDIDVVRAISSIASTSQVGDHRITAITPVLDTVWVGTGSGHILIYQRDQLLMWYHSYSSSVRFLTAIYGPGPCGTERAVVVSGGNEHVQALSKDLVSDDEPELPDGLDYLVMWEAYDARTLQQIKLVQHNSPVHLDSYGSIRQMLYNGEFEDGTCILSAKKTEV